MFAKERKTLRRGRSAVPVIFWRRRRWRRITAVLLAFYAYLSTSCFTSLRRSYQPYDERVRRNNGSLCLYKVQACASYGFRKQPALPFLISARYDNDNGRRCGKSNPFRRGNDNRMGNPRDSFRFRPCICALYPTPWISNFFSNPCVTPTTILFTSVRHRPCRERLSFRRSDE